MLTRDIPARYIIKFSFIYLLAAGIWSAAVVCAFYYLEWTWLAIPFLPISLIGIAVSFYLGFKNTASNERLNEARKNWGAVTNDSRAFVSMLNLYLPDEVHEARVLKTQILKRHLAWLYAHKFHLHNTRMEWEHDLPVNEKYRNLHRERFDIHTVLEKELRNYISDGELREVESAPNIAAALLHRQYKALKVLREKNLIEDFRLFELQNHLNKFFEYQGKNERIKTFPIPRQYSTYANIFVIIFSFLLPMGLLKESAAVSIWLTIPFSTLTSWVFYQMKLVGEYSEHPYEGLIGDVPISAIIRNIEIEVLHALGETNLPERVKPVDGVLL